MKALMRSFGAIGALMGISGFGNYGSVSNPVIIHPPAEHITSRSGGRGGEWIKPNRPRKQRRQDWRFRKLTKLRTKYNIWHESQLDA